MTRTHASTLLAAVVSAALSPDLAAQGSFIDLGTVNPPNSPVLDGSKAYDISDDGRTVVGSSTYGDFYVNWSVQFRWHATTGLVDQGTANGADHALARRVTPDGTVALGTLAYPIAQFSEPSIWDPVSGLQRLGPNSFLDKSYGVAMSSDGDRVFLNGPFGDPHYFTRSTGTNVTIPKPATSSGLVFFACDDSGTLAVGMEEYSGVTSEAAVWREGIGTTAIPITGLGQYSRAIDVSPDGNLVMGDSLDTSTSVRTTWLHDLSTGATTVARTTPPAASAARMSGDGSVIVYHDGAVWTSAMGNTDLTSLLAAAGATPPVGATLVTPTAVSPDGLSFAGHFVTSTAQYHAFVAYLVDPVAQNIGEPVCASVVPNSTGAEGVLDARGSVLVEDNDVTLVASRLPANATTLFLNSPMAGFTQNPGGNVCLGGQIGRYYGGVTASDAGGAADLTLDVFQTPRPTSVVAITAGETWYFQAWHRDVNSSSNLTDAVAVAFN